MRVKPGAWYNDMTVILTKKTGSHSNVNYQLTNVGCFVTLCLRNKLAALNKVLL